MRNKHFSELINLLSALVLLILVSNFIGLVFYFFIQMVYHILYFNRKNHFERCLS